MEIVTLFFEVLRRGWRVEPWKRDVALLELAEVAEMMKTLRL